MGFRIESSFVFNFLGSFLPIMISIFLALMSAPASASHRWCERGTVDLHCGFCPTDWYENCEDIRIVKNAGSIPIRYRYKGGKGCGWFNWGCRPVCAAEHKEYCTLPCNQPCPTPTTPNPTPYPVEPTDDPVTLPTRSPTLSPSYNPTLAPKERCEKRGELAAPCCLRAAELGLPFNTRVELFGAPVGCILDESDGRVKYVRTCSNHENCGTSNCHQCTILDVTPVGLN